VAHKTLPSITDNPQKSQQSNMIISLYACNFLGAGAHDEVAWYTIMNILYANIIESTAPSSFPK